MSCVSLDCMQWGDLTSGDLLDLIESDMLDSSESYECEDVSESSDDSQSNLSLFLKDSFWNHEIEPKLSPFLVKDPKTDKYVLDPNEEDLSIMVNPRTGLLVTYPYKYTESSSQLEEEQPQKLPAPYHPNLDHDYFKVEVKEEVEDECDTKLSGIAIVQEMFKKEDEPVVEVWKIDNFNEEEVPIAEPTPKQLPAHPKRETRRTSTRTADLKQKEQARKISNAVHASFKNNKARRVRQSKNVKPKNSVETTPSQSDIEEWYSQPVRATYTKITKKKTSKGRIDHSESERHRREVLRRNFAWLCGLLPDKYKKGEKASAQVSKQKILNGAQAFIRAVHEAKGSYIFKSSKNELLRERWQKILLKSLKCVKKLK